mmetsp:Transcript_13897/g.58454  ORF Transcript_13897/g.58454 Transcript_13897/m.58454 type:complete len:299 (+) Transcript_13897:275-1171(+)
MRSRESPYLVPMSPKFMGSFNKASSSPAPIPYAILKTFRSRGASVASAAEMSSCSSTSCTVSNGSSSYVTCSLESIRSPFVPPRLVDTSAVMYALRFSSRLSTATRARSSASILSGRICAKSASSARVGLRPCLSSNADRVFCNLDSASYTCTGSLIVRLWSFTALEQLCRIHQCAYVENLNPLSGSNPSTPRIKPPMPSWMRSSNATPRPMNFFATLTTKRKLCRSKSCFERFAVIRNVSRSAADAAPSAFASSACVTASGSLPSLAAMLSRAAATRACCWTFVASRISSSFVSSLV